MPTKGRAMGIDHGDARVGVAVADALGILAHPRETIRVGPKGDKAVVARIAEIAAAERISVIVVGLPRHLNGTEGVAAGKARAFAEKVRAVVGCEVRLQDERLTTVAAQKALHASGRDVRKSRAVIDQAAAQLILQTYLDTEALKEAALSPEEPD